MSASKLKREILELLVKYISEESPENGLRLLLELDKELYELEGQRSVASGAWVVGIDLNEKHIEVKRMRHSHPRVTYIVGNLGQSL